MHTHLISYDLQSPGKNYPTLHSHLQSYPNWAKPLESLWLIQTDVAAEQVRDQVQQHVDHNDKVLVIDLSRGPMAWSNLPQEVSNWLKKTNTYAL